ncbi:hypothetical protein [Citricoccus nitrophenolicus]|uniref:hypothetical protein n=1 Tax=Citricoccus nitrophenolicus TaxID=863575 RepID=UPI003606B097
MSSSQGDRAPEVGRFYSGARNFKQVLGSFPDGSKIPGGPYTFTQFGVLVGSLFIAWITNPLWSIDLVSDVIIGGGAAFGLALLAGRMPGSRRNPIRVIVGIYGLLVRPRRGVYRGRPMRATFSKASHRQLRARKGKPTGRPQESVTLPSEAAPVGNRNFSSLDLLRADLGISLDN